MNLLDYNNLVFLFFKVPLEFSFSKVIYNILKIPFEKENIFLLYYCFVSIAHNQMSFGIFSKKSLVFVTSCFQ